MNALSGRRPGSPLQDEFNKKRRVMVDVRDFVDIEASEAASGDGETTDSNDDGQDGFIEEEDEDEDDSVEENLETGAPAYSMASNDNMHLDYRLEEVINRYDAQISRRQHSPNVLWNETIDSIADGVTRMPIDDDPPLWRVRVRAGTEEESFYLLHERLEAWPRLALAVFLPPGAQQWICVESGCREYVEKLCVDLSTFPHPLHIFFVPAEERLTWLKWRYQAPLIITPAWGRLKTKSELKELLSNDWNVDERILKYANDLVYVDWSTESTICICIVPRLPVPISGDEDDSNTRQKTKRMQRLLHPLPLGDPDVASQAPPGSHMIDPTVWWFPNIRYDLRTIKPPVYRLTRSNRHGQRPIKGGDDFVLPFAFYEVPHAVLRSERVVPKLSELSIFAEGMTIGGRMLRFVNPHPNFMRWTYENHIAAPLEIGQKVEVKVEGGMKRGIIEDIFLGEVTLRTNNKEEMGVDLGCVRRFYEVGDTIKVVKASNLNREGWVVGISEGEIEVFDRNMKEHFHVQSWQLVPHDGFHWGLPRRIQVGDTVRVISPISPDYGERGRVANVTELGVEVIGSRSNTKFMLPHWFLEVELSQDGLLEDRSRKERISLAHYDRYRELVNTWVHVTGDHAEKGLYGRIRESLGEGLLRIEDRAGTRLVNIHIDYLLNDRAKQGRDLTPYYIKRYQTPATMGRRLSSLPIVQPVRATTPGADELTWADEAASGQTTPGAKEPTWPEESPSAQQDGGATPGTEGSAGNANLSAQTSDPAAAIHLPQLPRRLDGETSYEEQVLPANWLMKADLVTKRIWAHVRNTKPSPFDGGFAKGRYEGQRVLILSGEGEGEVVVSARHHPVKIPGKYLSPEIPTSKGQDVVVIRGDNVGEVYLTRKPIVDGFFPLGRRGYTSLPLCIMEASRLARCDPLSKPQA